MRPHDVLESLRAEPFEPFEVQRSTGERFVVHHPKNLLMGHSKCYVPVFDDEIVERMVHIALMHTVRIELLSHRTHRKRPRKPK